MTDSPETAGSPQGQDDSSLAFDECWDLLAAATIGRLGLVVDDHPAFRRALTSALKMVKGIEVAGEAGGGREATDRARVDEPDLILMDLSMPDFDGIEAMRRIHEDRPDLPVVILTAHADPGVEKEAREAGASGFLAKGTALEDIVIVLHEATEGAA